MLVSNFCLRPKLCINYALHILYFISLSYMPTNVWKLHNTVDPHLSEHLGSEGQLDILTETGVNALYYNISLNIRLHVGYKAKHNK